MKDEILLASRTFECMSMMAHCALLEIAGKPVVISPGWWNRQLTASVVDTLYEHQTMEKEFARRNACDWSESWKTAPDPIEFLAKKGYRQKSVLTYPLLRMIGDQFVLRCETCQMLKEEATS